MFFHEAITAEEIDNLEMSAFNGRITVISKLGKEFDYYDKLLFHLLYRNKAYVY